MLKPLDDCVCEDDTDKSKVYVQEEANILSSNCDQTNEKSIIPGRKRKESEGDAIVALKNVRKTYLLGIEGVPALRGVDLNIERGDFVVIVGKSGSGKSSMLNIIGT